MAKELPTVAEGERAERCETCKWWGVEEGRRHTARIADCRISSPAIQSTSNGIATINRPIWPRTQHDDFCGEWQAK